MGGGAIGSPMETGSGGGSGLRVPARAVGKAVAVYSTTARADTRRPEPPAEPISIGDAIELPLIAIAHARSGDKGADANVGVRARHPDFVPILREQLTAARVAEWLAHRIDGSVTRYEVPGIHAFNFVLRNALGGGGISSLRFDPQGKAYAQQLLDMPIELPAEWLLHPALAEGPEVEAVRRDLAQRD